MNIKSILPLLTCLIHGQMRPPLALTSEEKKGMFPRLKVRMEKLLKNPNLDVIDKWYIDTLPNFINLQTEEEISNAASEELLKLLDDKEHSYTPIEIPDALPIMKIEVNVPNGFAELFYDVALRLEMNRTWLWLKREENRLQNEESILQVVRNVLKRLNEFSKECILRQQNTKEECNEIIKLRIMQLYFAIEYTFCKRDDWREYLEEVCLLPLTLDEYCYRLWKGCPEESWREAYIHLSESDADVKTPNLSQFADSPKVTTAAEKFIKHVASCRFEELPLVKALNPKQQAELIELMVKDACYAAAMLKYLGYYDRLKDVYQKNKEKIAQHCAKALGHSTSSFRLNLYSLYTKKDPYKVYEKHNSQVFFDNGQIIKDYNRIKASK